MCGEVSCCVCVCYFAAVAVQFEAVEYTVEEGDGSVTVPVQLVGQSDIVVEVDLVTVEQSANCKFLKNSNVY